MKCKLNANCLVSLNHAINAIFAFALFLLSLNWLSHIKLLCKFLVRLRSFIYLIVTQFVLSLWHQTPAQIPSARRSLRRRHACKCAH